MKKNKWAILVGIIIAILAGLLIFNTLQTKPVIGIMLETLEADRWPTDVKFLQEELEKAGYASVYTFVGTNNATYIPAIEQLTEKNNIQALIYITSNNDGSSDVLKYAKLRNIPIIAYDVLVSDVLVDYYVSHDTYAVGKQSAEATLAQAPKGAYLYIQGDPKNDNALIHRAGAFSVLDPKIADGSITMLREFIGPNWSTKEIKAELDAYIAEHPEIIAVVAANDGLAEGTIELLLKNKRTNVAIGGQDAELSALQRILAGTQTYTIYKPLRELAAEAARVAVLLAEGKTPTAFSTVKNEVGNIPTTMLPVYTITKENIDDVIRDGFYTHEQVYGAE